MSRRRFTRRDFLKLAGSALAGLTLSSLDLPAVTAADSHPEALGRVAYNKVTIYDIPAKTGKKLGALNRDEIIHIGGTVTGLDESAYNRSWYPLDEGGYVYSGGIQPVENILNQPVTEIPTKNGLLAELTVPFADTRWKNAVDAWYGYRLYYGSTHWVRALVQDENGENWYRVYDDLMRLTFYVRAAHLRVVPPDELAPLSPDVPDENKHLIVSLPEQRMAAYEEDRVVFSARISSGKDGPRTSTPTGGFHTFFKRPAGHMVGGDGSAAFDLPGIPWTSYINDSGISFHGVYWHNDFGTPHSHGCVNLSRADAKWLYRWASPAVPFGERQIYQPGAGTTVYISGQPVFEMGWR